MPDMILVECPVCCFKLKGTPISGYRCVKCHSHYSTKFVRKIRRRQFGELIDENFGLSAKTVEVEESTVIVENAEVEKAIQEAKEEVHETSLEDYLDLTAAFSEPDVVQKVERELPIEFLKKTPKFKASYDTSDIRTKKVNSRKKR